MPFIKNACCYYVSGNFAGDSIYEKQPVKSSSHLSVFVALLSVAMSCAHASNVSLPRSTPEAQGISSQAILDFLEVLDKTFNTMHSFMIVRHGKVISEGWWKPEAADKPHIMHSVSKSFDGAAVGLAIQERKLRLDDHVLKFFPAEAPANTSKNLEAMTVRDLLTMSGGDATEPQAVPMSAPSVKQFLAHPVPYTPGTHFVYNAMGSYVLSATVTKVNGQTELEYLNPRLFEPLGIEQPKWELSPEGYSLGGYALWIRTEDMAKFGQLYLQKAKWNGKQLIPQNWVEQSTIKQISTENAPHARIGTDWKQGYGFQFWRCRNNAFRADGSDGQFIVVIPDQDVVVAMTADSPTRMQGQLDAIWDFLLPAFQANALPDDASVQKKLKQAIGNLTAHPMREGN